MTDGTPWAGGCFAAGEFTAVQESVALTLRILLSGLGVFLGWLVAKPVARGIYRLAFQQPIPPKALTASRLGAAIVCGVLVFLLFPLGYGGGGGGRGGGKDSGNKRDSDKGDKVDKGGKAKGSKDVKAPPGKPGETARVEMIVSKKYKHDQRWYLIEGKEPPLLLVEVDAYLKNNKDLKRLEIIIWGDSVPPNDPAVLALVNLAERQYGLYIYRPREYWGKKKSD